MTVIRVDSGAELSCWLRAPCAGVNCITHCLILRIDDAESHVGNDRQSTRYWWAKVGDVELAIGFPEVDQDIEWTQRARGVHVRFNRKD